MDAAAEASGLEAVAEAAGESAQHYSSPAFYRLWAIFAKIGASCFFASLLASRQHHLT
jgi:hypothetical protein